MTAALAANPQALCETRQATVQFGRVVALQGVNLRIHSGERVALVGSNGSGKSSLLRLLHGLVQPGSGSASVPVTRRSFSVLKGRLGRMRKRELSKSIFQLMILKQEGEQHREQQPNFLIQFLSIRSKASTTQPYST